MNTRLYAKASENLIDDGDEALVSTKSAES